MDHSFYSVQFFRRAEEDGQLQRRRDKREEGRGKRGSPQTIKLEAHFWHMSSVRQLFAEGFQEGEFFFPDHQPLNWTIVVFSSEPSTLHNLPFTKEAGHYEQVFLYHTGQRVTYFFLSSWSGLSYIRLRGQANTSHDWKSETLDRSLIFVANSNLIAEK